MSVNSDPLGLEKPERVDGVEAFVRAYGSLDFSRDRQRSRLLASPIAVATDTTHLGLLAEHSLVGTQLRLRRRLACRCRSAGSVAIGLRRSSCREVERLLWS